MRTYLIKRLLLMIPTIFGISLVVFVIITNAPGSPAAMKAPGGESAGQISSDQVASKETYQIFKKHFHLDKGIVFNHYPWLTRDKIEKRVEQWMSNVPRESISASDALSDFGPYAIPFALELLDEAAKKGEKLAGAESEENLKIRRNLIVLLAQNSIHDISKVERAESGRFSEKDIELLDVNKELHIENALFRDMVAPDKSDKAHTAGVEAAWQTWYRGLAATGQGFSEVQPSVFDEAFAAVAAPGTPSALRRGGEQLGGRIGLAGAKSLAAWVLGASDENLPRASEFAANALSAAMPLRKDAHRDEVKIRRKWVGVLTASEGGSQVHFKRVKERWAAVSDGRMRMFERSPLQKIAIALFDTRFAHYWRNLIVLDFGYSMQYKGKRVSNLIWDRLQVSVTFALLSFLIAYSIAIPIGIYSAVRKDSIPDRAITLALFVMYSMPSFFVAVLLQRIFTIGKPLSWFPSSGFTSPDAINYPALTWAGDLIWHLVLPLICLTMGSFAALSRYMRGGLLEVIRSDYIRTARAKGLSEFVVIFKHALRNGLIPILTMIGNILPALISGSVIIEVIFNIPGMGQLMVEAIFARDYNLVMADSLIVGFLVLCGMLVSDMLYVVVDPRITFD